MTYSTIGKIASAPSMFRRISAAVAQEGEPLVQQWVMEHLWAMASQPGWEAAWETAEQTQSDDTNPDIAARGDVITDGMILSAVQSLRTPTP